MIVGILLIRHPIGGVAAIALFIGIWLAAVGVVRLAMAFDDPRERTWNLVVAGLELVAGIAIVASPDIGLATLALLVGISFIVNGFGLLGLGASLRSLRKAAADA